MNTSKDPRGVWAALFGGLFLGWYAVSGPTAAAGPQCVDFSKDPAGCQPSTFKTPMAQMPTVRVNRQGEVDPTSSEEDAQSRRRQARKGSAPVPELRAAALGAHGAVGQGSGDRSVEGRRPRRRGRRARSRHRRQLHLRRSWQRRRRAARDQHFQDPAESREAAAGAGRRDPGDVRRQSGVRRPRAPLARLQDVERRRSLHPGAERRHEHDRPNGNLPHRHEHLPADVEERDHRLPFAVARILPLARSGESESRAGLHGDLDRRPARSRSSRPEDSRRDRAGRDRREDRRGPAQGQGARRVQLAGSGRASGERKARRHGSVLRRPLPGFQRPEEPLGPRREFPEQRAEPVSFDVGLRGWRAGLRRGHDRGVLRARHRSDCASHRRRAGRRHGRLQSALDDRLGQRRDRSVQAVLRSPTTASTWS